MGALVNTLLAVLAVSLVSFVGALFLFLKVKKIEKMLTPLVSFAAGSLLAAAFFHMIPEAAELGDGLPIFTYILGGILLFFVVEKLLNWYHCHDGSCVGHHSHPKKKEIKPVAWLNIIGDGAHNFLDGAIIAAAFITDAGLGLVTTFAVIMHEIPQEISDFSILIYAGFSRGKALFYNFLSALMAVVGAVIAYFLTELFEVAEPVMLSLAAGGFLYISLADLIPELHHDQEFPKSLLQLIWFGIGVLIIYLISAQFGV